MFSKSSRNSSRGISGSSSLPIHHNRIMVNAALNHITRDITRRSNLKKTSPRCKKIRVMGI
jgi:hypothetical protein